MTAPPDQPVQPAQPVQAPLANPVPADHAAQPSSAQPEQPGQPGQPAQLEQPGQPGQPGPLVPLGPKAQPAYLTAALALLERGKPVRRVQPVPPVTLAQSQARPATPVQPASLAQRGTPVHKARPEATVKARKGRQDRLAWAIQDHPDLSATRDHKDRPGCLQRDPPVQSAKQDPPDQVVQDPRVQLDHKVRLKPVLRAISVQPGQPDRKVQWVTRDQRPCCTPTT